LLIAEFKKNPKDLAEFPTYILFKALEELPSANHQKIIFIGLGIISKLINLKDYESV